MTHHYTQHYIDGRWQTAHDDKVFDVHDASTEEVMATVPQGTAEEAAQAVMAARKAFPAWAGLSVEARCEYIDKIVAGLKARTDEMGLAIARSLVEEHGGRIGVESVEGRGATFWFTLPLELAMRSARPVVG